jgi:hypothetical protein
MAGEREQALEEAAAMLDGWATYDEWAGDKVLAGANRLAAACIRALKVPGAREACVCTGCPVMVETDSRSGLCAQCAGEDCDHDELGAEAGP